MEQTPLPDATFEMVKFIAEMNAENNEKTQKRDKTLKRLQKKRTDITEALVGIGNALKSLTEQKEEIEQELVSQEKELAYKDVNGLFVKKFGINMYGLNQNPKLTQRQVDAIKEIDD